jgi:hypothetical protein
MVIPSIGKLFIPCSFLIAAKLSALPEHPLPEANSLHAVSGKKDSSFLFQNLQIDLTDIIKRQFSSVVD